MEVLKIIKKISSIIRYLPAPYCPLCQKKVGLKKMILCPMTSMSLGIQEPILSKNYIFTDLPAPYWKELKDNAVIKNYKRREIIYLNGDSADNVYLVMNGLVMLSRVQSNGFQVGQSIVIQQRTFGEQEVLNQSMREQQATAISDCQLCVVSAKIFDSLSESSAKFSRSVARLISQRHRRSECRLACLTFLDVPHRLAQLLLEMAHAIGYKDHRGHHFSPSLTHHDMATLIFSSRETVCSIMSDFRNQRIIDFDRKHVSIINEQALANY